mmetsp:Transcript_37320/g.47965  ORF Transcript_37320/g.47965 Transcript_37320/m.47965 type:complete len:87 (+) Transcript_37320:348-608(+)
MKFVLNSEADVATVKCSITTKSPNTTHRTFVRRIVPLHTKSELEFLFWMEQLTRTFFDSELSESVQSMQQYLDNVEYVSMDLVTEV